MFLTVRQYREHITQLHRLKVKDISQGQGIYPWFLCPLQISWPLRAILSKLHPNVPLSQCAEHMTRLCKLNVKVTLQGCVIYPPYCAHFTSPKLFERFSLNFTQMFLSVMQTTDSALQTQGQGHTSMSWVLSLNFVSFPSPKPFARVSLNTTQMFLTVSWLHIPWLSYATPKPRSHSG